VFFIADVDWNQANTWAAIASSIIAAAALVVSVVSIFVAVKMLNAQHRHNMLSVKPLASISRADYEDKCVVGSQSYLRASVRRHTEARYAKSEGDRLSSAARLSSRAKMTARQAVAERSARIAPESQIR